MTAYYNEFDPAVAAWLRELIKAGLIADGVVDERSIEDVHPGDLTGFTQCHFFAGIGGWSYALRLAGWPDDRPVWTGSCPCQPFSTAGKGAGFADERHLWPYWFHLIKERRPAKVFGEQTSSGAGAVWLDQVQADVEAVDYAFGGSSFPAASVKADQIRQRIYFFADAQWHEQQGEKSCAWPSRRMGGRIEPIPWDEPWESALSRFRALEDGIPRCVVGTDGARNAIVPQAAAAFIRASM